MIEETDSKSVLRQYAAAVQAADVNAIRGMFDKDAPWTLHAGRLPISGT